MVKEQIEKIFWRKIQPGDLFNSEKELKAGPKGQIHMDIAPSESIEAFLGVSPVSEGKRYKLEIGTIGQPDAIESLEIYQRPTRNGNARWSFPRQNRAGDGNQRPTAWTEAYGWPTFQSPPQSKDDAADALERIGGLFIYLVRTTKGNHYAGMTTGNSDHLAWPDALVSLLSAQKNKNAGCLTPGMESVEISPLARRIIEQFGEAKNILVYGPPGTGKSHAVAEVYRALSYYNGDLQSMELDPYNVANPFSYESVNLPFPFPARADWVTFHPEFGYEGFIKGLRPSGRGLELDTVAGALLDLALDVTDGPNEAGLLVIDEINRGNVPRILGDFITFMDSDYRAGGTNPIDSDLPKVPGGGANSGIKVSFQEDPLRIESWKFPDEIYVLATMNSVDKSVAPIDSAIGRRFVRLDAFADYEFLAESLGVDLSLIGALFSPDRNRAFLGRMLDHDDEAVSPDWFEENTSVASYEGEDEIDPESAEARGENREVSWTPQIASVSLLIYLNEQLTLHLDTDSTLGHTYFLRVRTWQDLANAWDTRILPQLQDRFSSREEILKKILRLDQSQISDDYALLPPKKPWLLDSSRRLASLPEDVLPKTFRLLIFGE